MLMGRAARMGHVSERSKKDKRFIALRPYEKQEPGTVIPLQDVTTARKRVLARGTLRLPMKPSGTHGKILVPGSKLSRRIVASDKDGT